MNRNGLIGLFAAGWIAVFPSIACADEVPQTALYTFQAELDAAGKLTVVTPARDASDETTLQLQHELQKWVFTPTQNGGVHASTVTFIRVNAIPASSEGGARIISATAGPAPETLRKPVYPVAAKMRGDKGVLVLELDMDAQGQVKAVVVNDMVGKISRRMAESAIAAAHSWTFRPEQVNGIAKAGRLLMPVCFVHDAAPEACAWVGPDGQALGRDSLVALDPAIRINKPIALADN